MGSKELQIVNKVLAGDKNAFSSLVEIYLRPIYNLCYRMLGNIEEAEDAAQETFLSAYRSLHGYDKKRNFATWILSIAAHKCIDWTRKKRFQIVLINDASQSGNTGLQNSVETKIIQRESALKVNDLLKVLKPIDRMIVVLYYWNDLSYEEISQVMNLSTSAVKSRLHRARRLMAKHWKEIHIQEEIVLEGVSL